MEEERKNESGFPTDESGEIFQADLTEELIPSPEEREPASHDLDLEGEETDSQAADDFMREHNPKPPA